MFVAWSHVLHDGNLGRDLSLGCPSFGDECSHMRLVNISVVVRLPLYSIHIVDRRVMEVMREGKDSSLERG